jgi:hypothetical protein
MSNAFSATSVTAFSISGEPMRQCNGMTAAQTKPFDFDCPSNGENYMLAFSWEFRDLENTGSTNILDSVSRIEGRFHGNAAPGIRGVQLNRGTSTVGSMSDGYV